MFNIYTPCPVGARPGRRLVAARAARLALESRAFPFLTYDPDAGPTLADCLSLDGNPALDDPGRRTRSRYVDDDGREADAGAAADHRRLGRDRRRASSKHFTRRLRATWTTQLVPFHEYLAAAARASARARRRSSYALGRGPAARSPRRSRRRSCASPRSGSVLVAAAAAGRPRDRARPPRDAARQDVEAEFEQRIDALRAEYEAKLARAQATTRGDRAPAGRGAAASAGSGDSASTDDACSRRRRRGPAPVVGATPLATARAARRRPHGSRAGATPRRGTSRRAARRPRSARRRPRRSRPTSTPRAAPPATSART